MLVRRIFVAWDSELKQTAQTFGSIAKLPPEGIEVELLGGPDHIATGFLDRKLPDAIARAHALLAVMDRPNANMAFEAGRALGHGVPVAFAMEAAQPPAWIRETPLWSTLCQRLFDRDKGTGPRDLLASSETWAPLEPQDRDGERKLLLCPDEGAGTEYRRWAARHLVPKGWELLGIDQGMVTDLPALLAGARQLAWVLLPLAQGDDRHGRWNAAAAIIAGYAAARQIALRTYWCDGGPELMDVVGTQARFIDAEDLVSKVAAWRPRDPDAAPSPLAAYLQAMHEAHAHPLPYIKARLERALDVVPVELVIDPDLAPECLDRPARRSLAGHEGQSLRALLEQSGPGAHFLVVAEPGAGKTTLLRDLAARLAAEQIDQQGDGPIPVFVSLAALEEEPDRGPLDLAAEQHGGDKDGVAALRRALGAQPDRLWLFLDGLDEVRHATRLRQRIQACIQALPGARVVVTARPVANTDAADWPDFHHARIRYLDDDKQHELVDALLDPVHAQRFWTEVADRPGFAVLRRNPFLLTLAAVLSLRAWKHDDEPPLNRIRLLQAAVDDCLVRGWGPGAAEGETRKVRDRDGARRVLQPLSLALQRRGGEAWPRTALAEELLALRSQAPVVRELVGRQGFWESNDDLLDDLHHNAGLIGPLDGVGGRWRFLHRSFKELLAAEAVNGLEAEARGAAIKQLWGAELERRLKQQSEELPRSGEVVAMVCELRGGAEAAALLRGLREQAPDLAVRALAAVEGLESWTRLQLFPEARWAADDLDAVIDALGETGSLWRAVGPERSVRELGLLWYTLERREGRSEETRQRFFEACRPGVRLPKLETVQLPAGSFWMGSPEGVGRSDEHPRHRVILTRGFRLGTTPVTRAQWATFAGEKPRRPNHPKTGVDWLGARLFAAWLGGRLPTEAEWEYACRAGTDTAYSFGDDPTGLKDHGWFADNSERSTHPVGELKANPWGLHDMHGNVWEWCEDRAWHDYTEDEVTDPEGPPRGDLRMVRGGSCGDAADWCRSGCRSSWFPRSPLGENGFRVLLPPAAPSLDP